jgi:zinc protease
MLLFGLPFNYYDRYATAIDRVTREDVERVARTYLDPAHATVVVVGDLVRIRPGIEALHLGPVVVVDANGRTVQ